MIYCCLEHVELALDIIVDEYETAPILQEIESEGKLSTTCEYCNKTATYIVGN
ncbi:MAG TPA: CxxH/CxxC protein [Bacillaceae bacterium]|nr:CxxH/CxxC protein [Paenibacillus bovis]HLU22138.1 CxxH/CxxC protein [Bacillaceae bacterium]